VNLASISVTERPAKLK